MKQHINIEFFYTLDDENRMQINMQSDVTISMQVLIKMAEQITHNLTAGDIDNKELFYNIRREYK